MELSSLQRGVKPAEVPLDRLADDAQLAQSKKVAEVSRQFEAVLLRQILDNAQKTVFQSKMTPQSASTGIYQDLMTNQLAEQISRSGALGLGRSLGRQLQHELKTERPAVTAAPTHP